MPGSTTQAAVLDVEREDAVQVFREIDDDAVIDGLAALRGAAAARGDDPPRIARDRERPQRLVHGAGHHHARRHDLVERGVGRIAAAAEGVEQHLAGDLAPQAQSEGAVFNRSLQLSGLRRRHARSRGFVPPCLARRAFDWQGEAGSMVDKPAE